MQLKLIRTSSAKKVRNIVKCQEREEVKVNNSLTHLLRTIIEEKK